MHVLLYRRLYRTVLQAIHNCLLHSARSVQVAILCAAVLYFNTSYAQAQTSPHNSPNASVQAKADDDDKEDDREDADDDDDDDDDDDADERVNRRADGRFTHKKPPPPPKRMRGRADERFAHRPPPTPPKHMRLRALLALRCQTTKDKLCAQLTQRKRHLTKAERIALRQALREYARQADAHKGKHHRP